MGERIGNISVYEIGRADPVVRRMDDEQFAALVDPGPRGTMDWDRIYVEARRARTRETALLGAIRIAQDALAKLEAEATGFVSMASREAHGDTNIAVLEHWILNARNTLTAIRQMVGE